jgi:hypothetical protein
MQRLPQPSLVVFFATCGHISTLDIKTLLAKDSSGFVYQGLTFLFRRPAMFFYFFSLIK